MARPRKREPTAAKRSGKSVTKYPCSAAARDDRNRPRSAKRSCTAAAVASPRRRGRVGVIGTPGTIKSGAYQSALARLAPELHVEARACPLFVPLAEEGWTDGEVARLVAREYLAHLADTGLDALVLGCTHYPLLKGTIASVAAELRKTPIPVVDSAQATAARVAELIAEQRIGAAPEPPALSRLELLVTDLTATFDAAARRFLGTDVPSAEAIDLPPAS